MTPKDSERESIFEKEEDSYNTTDTASYILSLSNINHYQNGTMNLPENTGLWQLYVCAAVSFIYSFVMSGIVADPCKFVFQESSCKEGAEALLSPMVAVAYLPIAVFSVSLAYINQSNTPKLKRLANLMSNGAMAMLVSIIFIPNSSEGGEERPFLHLGDLLICMTLNAILLCPTWTSSEMASPTTDSPLSGLGVNPKTFLIFVGIITIIKVIVMSEVISPFYIVADVGSVTALSLDLWRWIIVAAVVCIYPIVFAVFYGDEKDQIVLTVASVAMSIVNLLTMLPFGDVFKAGILMKSLRTGVLECLFGVAAIIVGRSGARGGDYEPV